MESPYVVHGRARIAFASGQGAFAALTLLLSLATAGCSSHKAENKPAAAEGTTRAKTATTSPASESRQPAAEARPANVAGHVRLSSKGCVEFDPHWTSIMVGQAMSWRSELKSTVVIHVSHGAFDKTDYVVRPGATVSTGPARGTGTYSIWTEPMACQEVPRGVQSSGPGITVKAKGTR